MTRGLVLDPRIRALPLDAVTRAAAILGIRGSGKTSSAVVLVEEMSAHEVPVVIIDPIGVWWGLQSSANGREAGIAVVIFGGNHANVPLEETSGELIANIIVEHRLSAIIDLKRFRKGASKRFVTDFLEALYHKNEESMHLVVDEADAFAPKKVGHADARMLGAMEDIFRRGRARGIGATAITQRPQSLHNDILTQCEILIAHRVLHPRDKEAIEEWIDEQKGDRSVGKRVLASLPELKTGAAWLWSPPLEIMELIQVRPRRTFDSSATPKPGARIAPPKKRAKIDLEAIKTLVASTIEKAEREDPKRLQARITELEKTLATRVALPAVKALPAKVQTVEIRVPDERLVRQLVDLDRKMAERFVEAKRELLTAFDENKVMGTLGAILSELTHLNAPPTAPRAEVRELAAMPRIVARHEPPSGTQSGGPLGGGETRMLQALAAMHPMPLDRAQLATLAGISVRSSGFVNKLSKLYTGGLIAKDGPHIRLTDEGRGVVGYVPQPKSTPELVIMWSMKLGGGERRMLNLLVEVYPRGLSRAELAQRAEISLTSSGFVNKLSVLNTNGLITKRGDEVFAADVLFPR